MERRGQCHGAMNRCQVGLSSIHTAYKDEAALFTHFFEHFFRDQEL
jgi:hypothetical protein